MKNLILGSLLALVLTACGTDTKYIDKNVTVFVDRNVTQYVDKNVTVFVDRNETNETIKVDLGYMLRGDTVSVKIMTITPTDSTSFLLRQQSKNYFDYLTFDVTQSNNLYFGELFKQLIHVDVNTTTSFTLLYLGDTIKELESFSVTQVADEPKLPVIINNYYDYNVSNDNNIGE